MKKEVSVGENLNQFVLFAFDDGAIPLRKGLRLHLNSFYSRPSDTVLSLGDPGDPDDRIVTYYGTVRRVNDELWMWYLGQGSQDENWYHRMCLARSKDGRVWERPKLGLVDYNGSKANNLVDIIDGDPIQTAVVFYEPDDPDASRRFKMIFESRRYDRQIAVAYSEDGIRWREGGRNPVGPMLEMAGGTRYNGVYYVNGQGGSHWSAGDWCRKLATHISYDFDHWSESSCLGLRRDPLPPRPTKYGLLNGPEITTGANNGPQVHLGAALWNRGNVIVSFYGMWNGHPSNDRRLVWMNLGLAISNDGLVFREPIPDFPIVAASETGYALPPAEITLQYPALVQGQGFENVGEETLFWYSPWPEGKSDGIRLATWERDRLGYLQPFTGPGSNPHFISAPVDLKNERSRISLNVAGISQYSNVTVSLLDERLRVLDGFRASDFIPLEASGLSQEVAWKGQPVIPVDEPIRVCVDFGGVRPEDLKLYAVYLNETE